MEHIEAKVPDKVVTSLIEVPAGLGTDGLHAIILDLSNQVLCTTCPAVQLHADAVWAQSPCRQSKITY